MFTKVSLSRESFDGRHGCGYDVSDLGTVAQGTLMSSVARDPVSRDSKLIPMGQLHVENSAAVLRTAV